MSTLPASFPPLAVLVVGAEVGVHRERRVAVLHVADELHDVAAVGRDAVALHRDLRAAAAEPHVAAGEVVGPGRASRSPRPGGRRCRSGRCTAETRRWASGRAGPGRRRRASLRTASASRVAAGRAPAWAGDLGLGEAVGSRKQGAGRKSRRVILSEAKDRLTHARDARGSLAPPTRSFAPLRMTARRFTAPAPAAASRRRPRRAAGR